MISRFSLSDFLTYGILAFAACTKAGGVEGCLGILEVTAANPKLSPAPSPYCLDSEGFLTMGKDCAPYYVQAADPDSGLHTILNVSPRKEGGFLQCQLIIGDILSCTDKVVFPRKRLGSTKSATFFEYKSVSQWTTVDVDKTGSLALRLSAKGEYRLTCSPYRFSREVAAYLYQNAIQIESKAKAIEVANSRGRGPEDESEPEDVSWPEDA
ncbi:MAG: hypothetical protein M1829_000064 [Trizodia sp. TS-e1964]|nr:MAG: hypothetical protein M1829_000064 [Trizodia sp. TS-e1964]